MKYSPLLIPVFCFTGCAERDADVSVISASEQAEVVESAETMTTSFAAGDSATLAVPEMSCAIMCYPKVKETLEEFDGIEVVELVAQKEEAVIDDRRVTVKFKGDVSPDAAVAALAEAGFADSKFE